VRLRLGLGNTIKAEIEGLVEWMEMMRSYLVVQPYNERLF
jgi:hypothetical protein